MDGSTSTPTDDSGARQIGRIRARVAVIAEGAAPRPRVLISRFPDTRILVCRAMQGYGKSVILAQNWQAFSDSGKLVVWLSLRDQFDEEASLASAIRDQLQWQIGADTIPSLPNLAALEDLLWNHPRLWRPILICIDGVECHARVLHQLEDFILTTPAHVQFIIAAGTQRGFSRLAGAPKMHTLHTHDLALTADEIETSSHSPLAKPLPFSKKEALAKTGGWPYLCQLLFHTQRPDLKASLWPEATCFFAEEIIERLTPEQRLFIEKAALIGPISAESFDYTFKTTDAAAMIQEINRDHLLFGYTDTAPVFYMLHPALRDYLELSYLSHDSRHKSYILKRSAFWHWRKREFKQAIDHALRAGDHRWARGLSEDIILDLALRQGEIETLRSWLSQFPAEELNKHPIVSVGYAWTLYFSQQAKEAEEVLGRVFDMQLDGNRFSAAPDDGWPQLVRAIGMATHDRFDQSEEMCREWISRYGNANKVGKATALTCLSVIAASQHRFDEMPPLLERAHIANKLARHRYAFGWYYVAQLLAAYGRGEMRLAQRLIKDARLDYNVQETRTSFSSKMLAILEIESLFEQGVLDTDQGQLSAHLDFAAAYGITDVVYRVYRTIARIHQRQANNKESRTILKRMRHKAEQRSLPRLVVMLDLEMCELAICEGRDHVGLIRSIQASPALAGAHARPMRAHLSIVQSLAALSGGQHALAGQHAKSAAQSARVIGGGQLEVRALLCQAAAHAVAGQDIPARKLVIDAQDRIEYLGCYQTGYDMRDLIHNLLDRSAEGGGKIEFRPFSQKTTRAPVAVIAPADSEANRLTKKQIRVLRYASEGMSNKQIAGQLLVSENTIKWHMQNIFKSLKSSNRVQAIEQAKRIRLI